MATKSSWIILNLCSALMLIPANAQIVHTATSGKLAGDLPHASSAAVDVIVQFVQTPTAKHHPRIVAKGGKLIADLSGIINGSHYSIPANKLAELADDPEVSYISPDRAVHGTLEYANPTVNANIARTDGWDGTGIGTAIIESGLQGRPDLNYAVTSSIPNPASRIVNSKSFLPSTVPNYTLTGDDYGHATHVAGILAGNGYKSSARSAVRWARSAVRTT